MPEKPVLGEILSGKKDIKGGVSGTHTPGSPWEDQLSALSQLRHGETEALRLVSERLLDTFNWQGPGSGIRSC